MRTDFIGLVGASLVLLSACGEAGAGTQSAKSDPQAASSAARSLLASLPSTYQGANLANGEEHFSLCLSCHSIIGGAPAMTGPNLHGVFGRRAGAEEGYAYSAALKAKGLIWTADTLDRWLAGPQAYVPGTKMSYPGVRDAADRRDVIAYLRIASSR